ncbi:MAG TPA: hypothetical protein DC047_06660 [Blastocatellia bacterium]|nr:hypothetical protein [Blastocatellia bacterium]
MQMRERRRMKSLRGVVGRFGEAQPCQETKKCTWKGRAFPHGRRQSREVLPAKQGAAKFCRPDAGRGCARPENYAHSKLETRN